MKLRLLALCAAGLALSGCYVAPPPGPGYRGCPYPYHWIPGHYGVYGRWHPGHCG